MKRLIQNVVVALFYLTTAFTILALPKNGKNWAVLISGGVGFKDYALQANICHAYQILHKNGIPDKRIIVMMGDEIARHKKNKKPGIIINKPGGPNVYKNVPKDYTGKNVNADNFVGILLGKVKSGIGSGKVLKSGPNDHVFVYFSGHGNTGFIAVGKKTEYQETKGCRISGQSQEDVGGPMFRITFLEAKMLQLPKRKRK